MFHFVKCVAGTFFSRKLVERRMKKFSQQEPRRRRKRAFLQSAEESDRFQPGKKGSGSRRERERKKVSLFLFIRDFLLFSPLLSRHKLSWVPFTTQDVKVVPSIITLQTCTGSKILVERANGLHDKTQNPFCRTKSAHSRTKKWKRNRFQESLSHFFPQKKIHPWPLKMKWEGESQGVPKIIVKQYFSKAYSMYKLSQYTYVYNKYVFAHAKN